MALAGVDTAAMSRMAASSEVDIHQWEGEGERGGGELGQALGRGHCGAARPARAGGGGEKGREGVGCCGPKRREGEEMWRSGFSYFLFPIPICI